MTTNKNIEKNNKSKLKKDPSLLIDFQKLQSMEFLKGLLDTLPYIVTIINKNREIIYTNDFTIQSMGYGQLDDIIGCMPGDLLKCQNAEGYPSKCGTTQKCKVCSILSTVLDSQNANTKITREARMISKINGKTISSNLLVTASPFKVNGEQYQVVIINDISQEKRRRILERIFFHDVINKSGSLLGLVKLLSMNDNPVQQKELLGDLANIATDLTEEILSQRDLAAAENGELKVTIQELQSLRFINEITDQLKYHEVTHKKYIEVTKNSEDITFHSDEVLVNRVVTNMIKNALEAINEGEVVTVSSYKKNGNLIISVFNAGYIPKDVQLQIFMRSFSTKSTTRGLGTYSMRLIAEQYLGGEVYFETNKQSGTTFFVKLPLDHMKIK